MCIKLGYTNPSIRATFLIAWSIIFRIHILFTWKKSLFSTLIVFKPWALVSSAVHLLIRSLWLCSAGTGEDEVDSRIHKPGWFKLLKSYVTLKPENPCWNGLWWFSWLKNCIASMKRMAQSSSSTKNSRRLMWKFIFQTTDIFNNKELSVLLTSWNNEAILSEMLNYPPLLLCHLQYPSVQLAKQMIISESYYIALSFPLENPSNCHCAS